MPQFPKQFIIIGDENLKEAKVVSTSPTNDIRSKKTGPVIASENNEGDMTAFLSGNPDTNVNYEFKAQTQGTTNDGTFVWKLSTETDYLYKGEPDQGIIHSTSLPSSSFVQYFPRSLFTVYSKRLKKEFCYYIKQRKKINISYRDYTRRGAGDWSETTFNVASLGKTFNLGHRNMAGATLKDGSVILALISDTDVDLYVSSDGLTFEILAESLFSTKNVATYELSNVQIAVSGNYVNLSVVSSAKFFGSKITSFVSADNGNSWTLRKSSDLTITTPGKWSYPTLSDSQDEIWSIGSLDNDGTFMLINVDATNRLRSYYATGSNAWSAVRGLTTQNIGKTKPCIVQTSTRVYIIHQTSVRRRKEVIDHNEGKTYSSLELVIKYIDKENFILGTSLFKGSTGGITSFCGSSTITLRDISAVENGSGGLNIVANLMQLNGDQKKGFIFFRIGGWDTFPLKNISTNNFRDNEEDLEPIIRNVNSRHESSLPNRLLEFMPFMGTLSAGFSYNDSSPWSYISSTAVTSSSINWRADRIRITDYEESSDSGFLYKYLCRPIFLPTSITESTAVSSGALTNLGVVDEFDNPVYITDVDTPDFNFAFIPATENADSEAERNTHGSLMSFVCKTSAGTTANGVDSFTVAGISTFIGLNAIHENSSVSTTRILNLEVRIGKENVCLYDVNGSSSVATLTPSVSTYGSNPFSEDYWEFRLAIRPYNNSVNGTYSTYEGYTSPKVLLMCRRLDKEEWILSGIYDDGLIDMNWSSDIVLNQMVYFGHKQRQGFLTRSSWKSFMIKNKNDFGMIDAAALGTAPVESIEVGKEIRGRYLSSYPIPIDDGLSVSWGGSGIAVGDTFHMDVDHTYSPKNPIAFESPNIKFQSIDNPTQAFIDIIYEAKDDKSFNHDAFAVFNTALEKVEINYSNDSTDFSTGTTHQLSLSTDISGSIVEVDNNVITLELDNTNYSYLHQRQITSSNKRSWYLKATSGQSGSGTTLFSGPAYKIDKSILIGSNRVQMLIDTENTGTSFPISAATCQIPLYATGVTMTVFSDKGALVLGNSRIGKYMKVRLTQFPSGAFSYAQLGTIVAGLTMPFDVELEWQYTDKENPNTEKFTTRNGTEWIYEKGSPKREISLSMKGDIDEKQRQQFRAISRGLSRYGKNPIVLVTLPESDVFSTQGDLNDHVILSRYEKSTEFQNDGWHYDEDLGIWTPIGNMSMIFDEIV